jgi:glutathione S-transferase
MPVFATAPHVLAARQEAEASAIRGAIMPLTLYLHPLSSYCHKALIALYENGTPFTPHVVDLGDAESAAAFKAIWPIGKFPVLADGDRIVPESTSIIEYLAVRHPGPVDLIPAEAALDVRAADRFFDLHVHTPMQKIIGDRIRPADGKDPYGAAQARGALDTALGIAERRMASRAWAAGDGFTMADCAAAPALFYCDFAVTPLAGSWPNLAAYLGRLKQRPSYARALAEARPYMHMVPR